MSPDAIDAPTNRRIAGLLEEAALLLDDRGENAFRIRAYRRAAERLAGLEREAAAILAAEGPDGLRSGSGIGTTLCAAIEEIVATGSWRFLDRLRAEAEPGSPFSQVPGIGPTLARRIAGELGIRTLEELEQAAHDGRLAGVDGFGPRRAERVRAALASILGRHPAPARNPTSAPDVAVLLELDREYREKAGAGTLRTFPPRRFNPEGRAWLPILETTREGRRFTVLFSNTAAAHEVGRTHDWVVIYFEEPGRDQDQCTVVTETRGPLAGKRVVRGREEECRRCDPE